MQTVELLLDDHQLGSLRRMDTAKAAVEICKIYFLLENEGVTFPPLANRADLHIQFPGESGFTIEIKGTKRPDIAWQQLKVSGTPSHDMLKRGMPLYRVCGVGSRNLKIFIMKYGEDFQMTPEPRWRIHPPSHESAAQD